MDGPAPPEEDYSSLPISDRLAHKAWKARVSAYESLAQSFAKTASDTDPAFKPYINNPETLKKMVTDSNAVAQEKGVECVVAFVKYAGETSARTRETVVPALVDKCFGSARAGTKTQALELSLQYVEMENNGTGVVADILVGLTVKQPKTVAGCVSALKDIIRIFGTQTTPPSPVLKALPKIFGHTDKSVRAEGTLLVRALYQYIGPAIEPWLVDLKPVQVKELKEAFEAMDKEGKGKGSVKPERLTRSQAREAEANQGGGEEEGGDEDTDLTPPDPRESAEPIDIVPKLPSSLQTMLTSSKWKERKEVLDELLALLTSTPRIKDSSELGDLAKSLGVRIQSDANINCVMAAAACIDSLAKGLMVSFARYRETVVPLMLERLKERKVNVTDSIGTALDAVFSTTSLSDIIPDFGPALNSKNPQVKEGTLKFLTRCLSTAKSPIQPAQIKHLSETLATLLEDGSEGARNEAASALGTLMRMVGERPLNPILDGLADVRKAKIKEAYEKATVKCKASTPGSMPKPAPAPSAAAPKKKTPSTKPPPPAEEEAPAPTKAVSKPPARLMQKSPAASTPSAPAATAPLAKKTAPASSSKPAKSGPAPAPGALDSFKYKHTPEEAEALAADLLPTNLMTDFSDANWKTRLAALDEISTWLEGVNYEVNAEVVIRAFAKKGWTEKNFQVSAKLYGILSSLAERCPSFGRPCVALCVGHLSEKLGDMKLKKPAGDTLLIFSEKTSLQFILNQAYDPLSKQKAPKVLADAIAWINTAITEFGIAGLSLRSLIDFLKTGLQNSNATVRTSATKTLVTVKLFAGSSIKDLVEDLNPQLLNTITSEFDKVEGTAPPEPTRTSVDVVNIPASGSGSGKSGGADALDELFPRVEIDSLLKGTTILTDAKSEAWKTKKEALETLQAILDQGSNKRLKPNMGEIGQVLKARVTDTNKTVQSLALDIVARVATGMGKPFEKQNRFFVLPVASVLSDQKAPIRASAVQTLTAIATSCDGLESMVPGLASALETSNPLQKGSLLQWIGDWFKEHEPASALDLSTWSSSIVSSLDDRNSEVRKGAQALLPILIAQAGFDHVMHQTNSLKPASRSTAVPIIQAARASIPTSVKAALSHPPGKAEVKSMADDMGSESPPETPNQGSAAVPSASKPTGVRRKLPLGSNRPESRSETPVEIVPHKTSSKISSGIVRRPGNAPASSSMATPSSKVSSGDASPSPPMILLGTNPDARRGRLGKDSSKWINEGGPTRKDLAEQLQGQMEPHASKDLVARLFSHDHNAVNDHISGLTLLHELYVNALEGDEATIATCSANFDLPLKYVSIKVHEPQPNLISRCLDVVEAVITFLRHVSYQLTENEATCFVPTMIHKLGDAREPVRVRIQQIIQSLSKIYAYSRIFQLLLDHGLKSKVAKTRQGTLDELAGVLKRSGISACEPAKAFPAIASMISDKDSQVRRSALGALSEGYVLVGERIWSLVGPLSPKDKTQLEERLRRVPGPLNGTPETLAPPQVSRLAAGIPRPASPATNSRTGGIPRPASPATVTNSKLTRPTSPSRTVRPSSPTHSTGRSASPSHAPRLTVPPASPAVPRPKTMLPSRLGRPRSVLQPSADANAALDVHPSNHVNGHGHAPTPSVESVHSGPEVAATRPDGSEDITITISTILSSDPTRSVEALKKVQKILAIGPDAGPSSPQYRELAEHTEGLIETITLQVAHIFERPEDLLQDENFRLAKHLIQTLNAFCDHAFLAESLTVDILTSLLEELTLRLLETDDSTVKKVKDLSRFINMILLRLFATGRRMSIFRALFALLLQIVKPFPTNGTSDDSKESKVAELVLKCVWKLVRNIPQDLAEQKLDAVELFPALEHFLQSVPPNEWRARATNKVPCGDMPLRTVKVIIQHVVAHYGDDVYDLLSASFDDPSATIVYPYVYRILNSSSRNTQDMLINQNAHGHGSPASSRAVSPQGTTTSVVSHRQTPPGGDVDPLFSATEELDPDTRLLTIINHISSETTGAQHKEGITELHHFLKAYPHKRPRVEKMLESTGAAFRKYITRALASRAAEDQERDVAVADTLSKLESNQREPPLETDASPRSPRSLRRFTPEQAETQEKLSRLHDLFQYRSNVASVYLVHLTALVWSFANMAQDSVGHRQNVAYDAAMLFWRIITQVFFREVRPRGAFNVPRDGPVIFVGAPHNNQFLDPLLLSLEVYKETRRHVQFLTAAKSMERQAVGFFARLMDSIPVARAADSAQLGTGRVWISPDDPCLVLGEGTQFLSEFAPRMQIMLPKSVNSALAEVTEVLSDTQLKIKREFGGESGKGTVKIRDKISELRQQGTVGLDFKRLPFVDQQEMYKNVYECLKQGGSIGIFPEGGSHDRTDILPLKAGVSIMALGAMANDPNCRVKIVPVGLSYFHAHKFRSRAVVEFGTAMDVPSDLVNMFKQGGTQKRDAVSKFLDLIYDALKTVTVRAPDYDTLMLIQAVRRLYKTPGQYLTLSQVVELNRRLLEGYVHFKDEPRVQKLRTDVLKYNRFLRDLGLRDHQVPRAQKASWKTLGLLGYRVFLLLIWTVLALPGTVLNGPIFIIVSIISRKKQKEALAGSVVKIAARDVLATWKVLISLGVAPVLYSLYALLATAVAMRANAPMKWRIMTPFLVLLSLPFMNYAALKFGEAGMDVLKSLRPLIVALVPGQQRSLDKLKTMRIHLSNEVAALINDFGPNLYDDFNEWRILVPSASAPPSSGTPGLWRRKSSTGAVDAQGLGLTHPMTWIDERLFGWSRSARRGTSAWGGFSGDESSRVGTPDESDEEDTGDYDNVIVPDSQNPKSRSRTSSYADLQRLRMSPFSSQQILPMPISRPAASGNTEADGLHFRKGQRNRKASLSDGVPVERIAAVNPQEQFTVATDDLNDEIEKKKGIQS